PNNLLLLPDGVKVADFGLAFFVKHKPDWYTLITTPGRQLGTPAFMAPEQRNPDPNNSVDARTGLYGLGWTLFYLLAGPTSFQQYRDMPEQHPGKKDPWLLVRNHVNDLSPEAERVLPVIVQKLLAKEKQERYEDAGQLIDA